MGLAHFATETDEYRGYRIPKGTAILPNVWGILHDPNIYPDPLTFDPTRFMDRKKNALQGINELPDAAFGFGRRCVFITFLAYHVDYNPCRMCPGRWFAFDTMWIIVASILSSYDIMKAVDDTGNTIEPKIEYSSGLLRYFNFSLPVTYEEYLPYHTVTLNHLNVVLYPDLPMRCR